MSEHSSRNEGDQTEASGRRDAAPDGPTDLDAGQWRASIVRAVREFQADGVTDWAAALTYYAVLSIFPALIALISILGVLGQSTTQPLIDNLTAVTPGPARDIFTSAIENIQREQGTAGLLLIVGIALAIWAASGYIGAFMRAANVIWDVEEGRPIYKTIPIRVAITCVMLVLLTVSALAVVLTGGLADQVGQVLGVGGTAVTIWDIAKWPVLVVIVALMLAILYYAAPNVRQPGFRWVTPGGAVAIVLWIAASAGFAVYVAGFGSYNETYGTLGGVVAFLVWLWITNVVILFGAELDAELARTRQIAAGAPPDAEPYLPPRDDPND